MHWHTGIRKPRNLRDAVFESDTTRQRRFLEPRSDLRIDAVTAKEWGATSRGLEIGEG